MDGEPARQIDPVLRAACAEWCELMELLGRQFYEGLQDVAGCTTVSEYLRHLSGMVLERGQAHGPGAAVPQTDYCFCGACAAHWTGRPNSDDLFRSGAQWYDLVASYQPVAAEAPECETCCGQTIWMGATGRAAMFGLLGETQRSPAVIAGNYVPVELEGLFREDAGGFGEGEGVVRPQVVACPIVQQNCPSCGRMLRAKRSDYQRMIRCPHCQVPVSVTTEPTLEFRVRFRCPECHATITGSPRYVGRMVGCPGCRGEITVGHPQPPRMGAESTSGPSLEQIEPPPAEPASEAAELFAAPQAGEPAAPDKQEGEGEPGAMDAGATGDGHEDDVAESTASPIEPTGEPYEGLLEKLMELRERIEAVQQDLNRAREEIERQGRQLDERVGDIAAHMDQIGELQESLRRTRELLGAEREPMARSGGDPQDQVEAEDGSGGEGSASATATEDGTAEAALAEARRLYRQGRYEQCVSRLEGVLATEPQCCEAMLLLGSCRLHLEDWRSAIRALKSCANAPQATQEQRLFCFLELGKIYGQTNRLRTARWALEAALSIVPQDESAHRNLGIVLAKLGDRSGAGVHLEASLTANPRQPQVRQMLEQVQRRREGGW